MLRLNRHLVLGLLLLVGLLAVGAGSAFAAVTTFTNSTTITIPDNSSTTSTITVSGVTGSITDVTVTLTGLSHTWPNDLDVLLTGPNGSSVMLFSDAGTGVDVNNINLTFSDGAGAIANGVQLVGGTFAPSNYPNAIGGCAGDAFTATHTTFAAAFGGLSGANVNGTWTLTVADDCTDDIGSVSGWSLTITDGALPVGPTITSGSPPNGTVGVAYSHTVTATGDPTITFSVSGGSLPGGLSLDTNTGAITGTPTTAGPFSFSITATNGAGSDVEAYTVTIAPAGVVPPPPPPPPPTTVVEAPPAPPCAAVNFEDPGMVRTHFTNEVDKNGLGCRMIAADGQYMTWLGGPLTSLANIGNGSALDLGVIAAVDVYSSTGQTGFAGDVVVCLKGEGHMVYLNANHAPRVAQLWSAWTTDAFPGYTCTTLYAPGTVVLVTNKP